MSDFHQSGAVTIFHRLGSQGLLSLESDLESCSEENPIALVLPCLALEVLGTGLRRIADALREVRYLQQIVVSVSGAKCRSEFEAVCDVFDGVETRSGSTATLIWNDGPRLASLSHRMVDEGLPMDNQGKGRGVWFGFGYVFATRMADIIVTHDCDIQDYGRELLARLCYPMVHPDLRYDFAKGYYARFAGRFYGRVTRLHVTPLLKALKLTLGPHPLLEFYDSFRYALAGECAMRVEVALRAEIPNGWGLEIATLGDVFKGVPLDKVCQVELADNFDHRHQDLSAMDSTQGLHKMAIDVTETLLRSLVEHGVKFDIDILERLMVGYSEAAKDAISRYADDSVMNGLDFDYKDETLAAATFSRALHAAGMGFIDDQPRKILLPSWRSLSTAIPGFLEEFLGAVEADAVEV